MKHSVLSHRLILAAVALIGFAAAPGLRAQQEIIITQPVPPPPPVIVTTPPVTVVTPPVAVEPAIVPAPGEHIAEIELAVSKGSVQAYFGRAARKEKLEIGAAEINIKLPSTATVTKLASRDKNSDGSKRVTPDNPWIVRVPFNGPGRYVFNIVEWDDDPVVTAAVVKVDGAVLFSGRGSEDNFDGWAQKSYAPNVSKSGSREIAFILP